MAKITVKCPRCLKSFDRNSGIDCCKHKTRWYHQECFDAFQAEQLEQEVAKELAKTNRLKTKIDKLESEKQYKETVQQAKIEKLDEEIQQKQELKQKRLAELEAVVAEKEAQLTKLREETKSSHKQLYDYIQSLFGDDAKWAAISRQITMFQNKYGYTEDDIYFTLRYFYDIRRGSIKKANGAIGIVPYIYDEAMEYFVKLERKKAALGRNANPAQYEPTVVKIAVPADDGRKGKKEIDLDNL